LTTLYLRGSSEGQDIPRLRSVIGHKFEKLLFILGELSVGMMGRRAAGRFVLVGIVQYLNTPLVV